MLIAPFHRLQPRRHILPGQLHIQLAGLILADLMGNTELTAPVPLAEIALLRPVMSPGEIESAPFVIDQGFCCVKTAAAYSIHLRRSPRPERRVGHTVNRIDELREAGIGKIPKFTYFIHFAAFRAVGMIRLVNRSIILPVVQIL